MPLENGADGPLADFPVVGGIFTADAAAVVCGGKLLATAGTWLVLVASILSEIELVCFESIF